MWFYKLVLPFVLKHMTSRGFKENLVKRVNESVDIPMLTEETEARVFEALHDVILNVLKGL